MTMDLIPTTKKSIQHYPTWVRPQYLRDAKDTYRILSGPLPEKVAANVYNVRSIANLDTPVELTWKPLSPHFRPEDGVSPVSPSAWGKGDGTVPAWSAYHVSVPVANRREFSSGSGHLSLMEDCDVLAYVYKLIEETEEISCRRLAVSVRSYTDAGRKDADSVRGDGNGSLAAEELEKLVRDIVNGECSRRDVRFQRREIWKALYKKLMR